MAGAEQRLAEYTRRVNEIQRRAEETQERIKTLRARATSQDGSVSVVLAPGGRLESLTLSPRSLSLGHERLAATITQTIQAAHAEAAAQTQQALQPLVGGTRAMEFLREQIGTALEEDPAATAADRRDAEERPGGHRSRGDDGDEFGGSILRRN